MFYITDTGIPFISTSSGQAFSYCRKLDSWMVVNSSDAVTRCALSGSNVTNVKNMRLFPLSTVQYISNSFQQKPKGVSEM